MIKSRINRTQHRDRLNKQVVRRINEKISCELNVFVCVLLTRIT